MTPKLLMEHGPQHGAQATSRTTGSRKPPLGRCSPLVIALLTFVALLAIPAAAQGKQPTDDEVNAVAKQLYCPVCENVPLDVCGTKACAQWRATIRDKLTSGWDAEEIKQYFADQYGTRVLAQPPTHGFNVVFWVVPLIVLVTGLLYTLRYMHGMRQAGSASFQIPPGEPLPSDGYETRLERELEQWP